jgi:hypothetical protein
LLAIKAAVDPKGMIADWKPSLGDYCKWANVVCDSSGNVNRCVRGLAVLPGQRALAQAGGGLGVGGWLAGRVDGHGGTGRLELADACR